MKERLMHKITSGPQSSSSEGRWEPTHRTKRTGLPSSKASFPTTTCQHEIPGEWLQLEVDVASRGHVTMCEHIFGFCDWGWGWLVEARDTTNHSASPGPTMKNSPAPNVNNIKWRNSALSKSLPTTRSSVFLPGK